MERIKDTLQNVFKELVAKKSSPGGNAPEDWLKKALTKRELGHIKFNYFRRGTLGLNVDSSSWLYSLNLKKEDLLKKLRNHLSGIKDIRFHIGEMG